jgi:hypothetical protein
MYPFSLFGINIEKIDHKYGIGLISNLNDSEHKPENITNIHELEITRKVPEVISFLDESKRIRKCTVSMIDFHSQLRINSGKYKCFWDRNYIPEDILPIGCPIRFIASRAIKTYHSELSKDIYSISEPITNERYNELKERKDNRISLFPGGYYQTDGVFCSFNCVMSFIHDEQNPMYRYSENLLLQMYNELYEEVKEIMDAPHWRVLKEFGGHLEIEQFRESFNKVEYTNHGIISCLSIGQIFEDQIRF